MNTGIESDIIQTLALYIPYAAQAVAQTIGTNTVQTIWDKVRQIFSHKGELVDTAMQSFESLPSDKNSQDIVTKFLEIFTQQDLTLKHELAGLLEDAKKDPKVSQFTMHVSGNVGAAIHNSGPGQIYIDQRVYPLQHENERTYPLPEAQITAPNLHIKIVGMIKDPTKEDTVVIYPALTNPMCKFFKPPADLIEAEEPDLAS